ncbi:MAG: helicase-related protein [Alphaproteobacteria bacterium]
MNNDVRIKAILGPTNTGKTWLAIDRMLSFRSGIIGFPLRLLARENYERAIKIKNIREVALITGEEKIIPPNAKYFFCTTESMPVSKEVDFIGVDEIQLCSDPERGHIFTDRLLHARGLFETMFIGAETITPFIRMLVPLAEIETRERLSTLRWAGRKSIERLPTRSAIVSFSTNDIYAIAELVRRQKGGAAVVLGALSPRTRNAQVEMYQAGEVDWLIATDAIGMGLNMDINHLAFAATKKFDGRDFRPLNAQELAQIAGRAGRGGNDGTFGVTAGISSLDTEMIDAIEMHEFRPPKHIYWRNSLLDFSTVEALIHSLKKSPPKRNMLRPRYAEDEAILDILSQDKDIKLRVNNQKAVETLWEIARIPDFSKTHVNAHAQMLKPILIDILDKGHIRPSWMEQQMARLDDKATDLEKLLQHIAAVRTLTYISYQKKWLDHAKAWQAKSRSLEDLLSDRLHESLTHRFVDRKTSALLGRLKQHHELSAIIHKDGRVEIEGHEFGYLAGFSFKSKKQANESYSEKAVQVAINKALKINLEARLQEFLKDKPKNIHLNVQGELLWRDEPIAYLQKGEDILSPKIKLLKATLLQDYQLDMMLKRLDSWLGYQISQMLKPTLALEYYSEEKSKHLRGVSYNLKQNLGSMIITGLEKKLRQKHDYKSLKKMRVYWGKAFIYAPSSLNEKSIQLRRILCQLYADVTVDKNSLYLRYIAKPEFSDDMAILLGYYPLKKGWLRIDVIEKMITQGWKKECLSLEQASNYTGVSMDKVTSLLKNIGFVKDKEQAERYYWRGYLPQVRNDKKINHDSPFLVLKNLKNNM